MTQGNWQRRSFNKGQGRRAKGHTFEYILTINDTVDLWVEPQADGTYTVRRSTYLGNGKFESLMLATCFQNATLAMEWADGHITLVQ